jgi:hypothetical protein
MTRVTTLLLVSATALGLTVTTSAAPLGSGGPHFQDPSVPQTVAPASGNPQRGARGRGARGMPLPDPQLNGPQVIDQLFDAYMVVQAQTALNLNEDQYLVFLQKARQLQTIRRRVQRERLQALAGLRETLRTQGPLDEAAVTEKLRAYDDLVLQSAPELRQAYAAIDQILKPRQRIQFRAFEEAMERKKLELIAMARQRQQAGSARAPQPTIKK